MHVELALGLVNDDVVVAVAVDFSFIFKVVEGTPSSVTIEKPKTAVVVTKVKGSRSR